MIRKTGADGLRAIACVLVIVNHWGERLNTRGLGDGWAFFGALVPTFAAGVSLFFVLSGFLLAGPFWEAWFAQQPLPSLRVYAVRRAGRILPGFYLSLLFCYVLSVLFYPGQPALFWRYLSGLSLTAGFHWLTLFPTGINGPLWSIGFELVSYALMPLAMVGLFALGKRSREPLTAAFWWLGVLALVLAVNQNVHDMLVTDPRGKGWQFGLVGGAKYWMPNYNPIGFFAQFTMGILTAGLLVKSRTSPRAQAWSQRGAFDLLSVLLILGLAGILWSQAGAPDFSFSFQDQPYYFPLFPATAGLLLFSLSQSRWAGRFLDNPVFSFLAKISFGLYIWHYTIAEILGVTLFPDFHYGRVADLGRWFLIGAILLGLSIAVASASWYLLEQPIIKRAQAWRPRAAGEVRSKRTLVVLVTTFVALVGIPLVLALANPTAFSLPRPWF
jgi:peptidoglycan/LPS O-acetylase OafA/YrhL